MVLKEIKLNEESIVGTEFGDLKKSISSVFLYHHINYFSSHTSAINAIFSAA